MTLIELCEPLFQSICRFNRAGRKGASIDFATIRSEVLGLFEEMKTRAGADFKLSEQYKKVDMPLRFFVDSMIAASKLPCAKQWHKQRLGLEHDELAGEDKFYILLEETQRDTGDDASERLAIFYICIGLGGLLGSYDATPENLRKIMQDIALRIRPYIEGDASARICPEAYEHTDTRDLIEPPAGRVWLMVVIFAICALTALIANWRLSQNAKGDLESALDRIIEQGKIIGT